MTDTMATLQRQIKSARELKSVVRTMKASAAAAIGQYENAVASLADYAQMVELGLGLCMQSMKFDDLDGRSFKQSNYNCPNIVIFGSDQGLVGQFNEVVVEHALAFIESMPKEVSVWAVGGRAHARLLDTGLSKVGLFQVPSSAGQITGLVGQILQEIQPTAHESLVLFFNRPVNETYTPKSQHLLPLDEHWQFELVNQPWPTAQIPELLGDGYQTLQALIREHLFISLFRASAESLASENASRLAAMQRADRNIGELLLDLGASYHRTRQSSIDQELFDVLAGFESQRCGGART